MKKFVIFALVLVILFSLNIFACSKNDDDQESSEPEVSARTDGYEGIEDFTVDEEKLPICSFGIQIYDGWIYYLERQSQWVGSSLRKCKLDMSADELVKEDVENMSVCGGYILCKTGADQGYVLILPDGEIRDLSPEMTGELVASDAYTVTLYGNKIFYQRATEAEDMSYSTDLYRIDLGENQAEKILENLQGFAVRNGQVVFMRMDDNSVKLMSYDMETGKEKKLFSEKIKDGYPAVFFGGDSAVVRTSPQKARIVDFSDLSKKKKMDLAPVLDNIGMSYIYVTGQTIYFNAIPADADVDADLTHTFWGYDRESKELSAYDGINQFDMVIYDGIAYYYDITNQRLQSIDLQAIKVQ